VWIGGYHDAVLDRSARFVADGLADAWFPGTQPHRDGLATKRDRFDAMLAERDVDSSRVAQPLFRDGIVAETREAARDTVLDHLVEGYEKQYEGRGHEPSPEGDLGHDVLRGDYEPEDLVEDRFIVGDPDDWVSELKNIQEELGVTFVHNTHDQEEALTMSDRVAVINHGRLEQVGDVTELSDRPDSRFVAEFLGETNLFEGPTEVRNGRITLRERDVSIDLDSSQFAGVEAGATYAYAIRPKSMQMDDGSPAFDNRWTARVDNVIYKGSTTLYEVDIGSHTLKIQRQRRKDIEMFDEGDTSSWGSTARTANSSRPDPRARRAWLLPGVGSLRTLRPLPRVPLPDRRGRCYRNFAPRKRMIAFASTRWVDSVGSSFGATSIRSMAPTASHAPSTSIAARRSALVSPPGSGVPVPGAYAGSTPSMSTMR
jgi:hypothetical protein